MALVKFAFVGLCVFLCLRLTSADTTGASSKPFNGDGDEMMPSDTGKQQDTRFAHLRGNGLEFGYRLYNTVGAYQNPNGPVNVVEYPCPNGPVNVVEYPCPGYGYVCSPSPSPCYQNPPSYGCQACNQVNMAQKVNVKNGAQESPKEATETMPRTPNKQ